MNLAKNIKTMCDVLYEKILVYHRRNVEKKKVKEKRRVVIYDNIELTTEQKKQIDSFYMENYGKKIPHHWHRLYTAYTGNFDYAYIPELLAIPEIEQFMNPFDSYVDVFGDKNVLQMIADTVDIKMPSTIISVTKGLFKDQKYNVITPKQAAGIIEKKGTVCFIKPSVDSSSGAGCARIYIKDSRDLETGESVFSIFERLGKDFIIQDLISCHPTVKTLYPNSVNTFRIITYRWNDEIKHCPVIMRIGKGGNYLDNAHAGGIFIAVDDDGKLHSTAFTEFREAFTFHPDTNVLFDGYKIQHLDEVIVAAKKMHGVLAQMGMVNWDFTIDENGEPILIEANTKGGSVWLVEMAHGCGAFGEDTRDILKYICLMKKMSPQNRKDRYWKSVE